MKSDIHPENYRLVAFKDMSNDDVFITKSTVETKETTKIDGVEYPLFKLEISRTSHPYYTGKSKLVDTAGRVDKFRSKYADFNKPSDVKEDTPVDNKQEFPETKTEEPAAEPPTEDILIELPRSTNFFVKSKIACVGTFLFANKHNLYPFPIALLFKSNKR